MHGAQQDQREVCNRFHVPLYPAPGHLKLGISLNVRDHVYPLTGLRIIPDEGTTGWFIWAGDYSEDPEFFVPLRVEHLPEWCPEVIRYVGLPPGWRFLVAPGYEDVWFDENLLNLPAMCS
jgi:hypothetical protein